MPLSEYLEHGKCDKLIVYCADIVIENRDRQHDSNQFILTRIQTYYLFILFRKKLADIV